MKYGAVFSLTYELAEKVLIDNYGIHNLFDLKAEKVLINRLLRVAKIPEEMWHKVKAKVIFDELRDTVHVKFSSQERVSKQLWELSEGAEYPQIPAFGISIL